MSHSLLPENLSRIFPNELQFVTRAALLHATWQKCELQMHQQAVTHECKLKALCLQ